jgi:hypothetical protein
MQTSGQPQVTVVLSSVNKPWYPFPEERLGSRATTDAVGDRKLSEPARNMTHFLGLTVSVLLTEIPTYPKHPLLNCRKIIRINISYSDNILYKFLLKQ